MNSRKPEGSRHLVAYLVSPAIALVAAATLLDPFGVAPGTSSGLAASSSGQQDQDGDGLPYRQERILETIPTEPDSDLDGFGDAEELARKTSPVNAAVFPHNDVIGLGITARGERNGLHALVALYVPDGNYQALQ